MSDLPTIPKAETASHYLMAAFIKDLAKAIGLTITRNAGLETDALRIFTILEESTSPLMSQQGTIFSLFVWCLSKQHSRHLEYIFNRNGRVTVRDHVASQQKPMSFATWRLGIVSLIEHATQTLEHIHAGTAACITRAEQIKLLYDTSSAPFLEQAAEEIF